MDGMTRSVGTWAGKSVDKGLGVGVWGKNVY
jgi:hypothetical protein